MFYSIVPGTERWSMYTTPDESQVSSFARSSKASIKFLAFCWNFFGTILIKRLWSKPSFMSFWKTWVLNAIGTVVLSGTTIGVNSCPVAGCRVFSSTSSWAFWFPIWAVTSVAIFEMKSGSSPKPCWDSEVEGAAFRFSENISRKQDSNYGSSCSILLF